MNRLHPKALFAGIAFVAFFAPYASAQTRTAPAAKADPFTWRWYEVDADRNLTINLYVFWRSACPHCPPALAYAQKIRQRRPWLKIRRYELSHSGNLELYRRMASQQNRAAGQTPAFFFCDQMMVGYLSDQQTGRKLEANLVRCYEHLQKQLDEQASPSSESETPASETTESGAPASRAEAPAPAEPERRAAAAPASNFSGVALAASPRAPFLAALMALGAAPAEEGGGELLELDLELPPPIEEEEEDETVATPFGEVRTSEMSLPALTLVIAGCDAFNPCAFFVLLSLMGVLIHAHSRWKMALVGGVFVLFSGVFYFLFMAAWLNVFLLAGHITAITVVAGILAIGAAAVNIKDYFWYKQGVSLSIPESAKPGLFERMRRLTSSASLAPMLVGAFALAGAANLYELLCTAGFPMIYTRVLTLRELPMSQYYGYLALYNLVYVLPLATIVAAFTFTLGRRKLQEREGRTLKLLSGVMMLLLGIAILAAPEMLQSVAASVGILAGAIGLTAVVVLLDSLWRRGSRSARPPGSKPARPIHAERDESASSASDAGSGFRRVIATPGRDY